jgi:trehalose synthase-fused probable maltokinase
MSFSARAASALTQSTTWLTSQRWYGDKNRLIQEVAIESAVDVPLEDRDAALVVLRFDYVDGSTSRYFVPVVDAGAGEMPSDALGDPGFLRWFVEGFGQSREMSGQGNWQWGVTGDDFPSLEALDFHRAKVIAAEQSNSSIVYDGRFIGKVFRRLQPGINPDLEIGEFLGHDGRFAHAPKLYGLVELEEAGGATAIAAVQEFVPNRGDGWSWLLGHLEGMDEATAARLVADIALLGQRTAELHVALASDATDAAFAPEPFVEDDADALIRRVIAEMEESVEALARRLEPAEVEQIHKGLGAAMGGAWSLVGDHKIRVHGDYHLGQTLRTRDDDFVLIDFEGEPSRPMEQRRMKQSPLKDVAGMLRSLDYAAATVRNSRAVGEPTAAIDRWLADASAAFVDAYRRTVAGAPVRIVPADDVAFTDGLNVLIAEKALYEVRYELNNRPDWLPIPLNALRRLAGIPESSGA